MDVKNLVFAHLLSLAACDRSVGQVASGHPSETPVESAPPLPSSSLAGPPAEASARQAAVDPDCPARYRCDLGALTSANPPRVTRILVRKEAHRLHLVADATIVRSYRVALGWGGMGQKLYEGDHVTPIGTYAITGKYPSKWHTYFAIDYPRDVDTERYGKAVAAGEAPKGRTAGSAIAIHGHRADQRDGVHKAFDWTLGCVALDNPEIDEVARYVSIGTRVTIEE